MTKTVSESWVFACCCTLTQPTSSSHQVVTVLTPSSARTFQFVLPSADCNSPVSNCHHLFLSVTLHLSLRRKRAHAHTQGFTAKIQYSFAFSIRVGWLWGLWKWRFNTVWIIKPMEPVTDTHQNTLMYGLNTTEHPSCHYISMCTCSCEPFCYINSSLGSHCHIMHSLPQKHVGWLGIISRTVPSS